MPNEVTIFIISFLSFCLLLSILFETKYFFLLSIQNKRTKIVLYVKKSAITENIVISK